MKERYINWKAQYAATPETNPSRGMMRAEIDILVGIYNHDRALFNKGMLKFKMPSMELLERQVDDEDETKKRWWKRCTVTTSTVR